MTSNAAVSITPRSHRSGLDRQVIQLVGLTLIHGTQLERRLNSWLSSSFRSEQTTRADLVPALVPVRSDTGWRR